MAHRGVEALARAVREDTTHGSSWLGEAALAVLVEACREVEASSAPQLYGALEGLAVSLVEARPSMPAIPSKLGRLLQSLRRVEDVAELRQACEGVASRIIEEDRAKVGALVEYVEALVGRVERVVTLSYSGTVSQALQALRPREVAVAESRPGLEGVALAEELASKGFRVTLLVDAALDAVVEGCDLCLLGADAVLHDGSVVNKVGSRLLCYSAREHGRPVYVLADSTKFHVLNYLGLELVLESGPPNQVYSGREKVEVANPWFEVVSPRLFKGVVSEEGLLEPRDIRLTMERMRRTVEPFKTLLDPPKP